ncbi:MAG TPA: homoserine dehydrogenase [Acidimicrobiia bacterium]|nr:homoserine dehydrogenase [Acidimicrobiia bacterium]
MTVRVGVLGAGTVGGALVNRLLADRDAIRLKSGIDLELRRVAVRDLSKERPFDIKDGRMTDDALSVVTDPSIDVIVEVIGGLEPAGALVLAALRSGKPVVTANKELIATRGHEITEAAKRAGVNVMYEAAVGGGIPVIRPLAESLAGEDIDVVSGIVNGTTNFILTAMSKEGRGYDDALAEAQRLGYAESDPADDVSGRDAAFKTSILASLAFGERVAPWEVECEGIEGVTSADVASATDRNEVIKLIGSAQRGIDGRVEASVKPVSLPADHPLAGVNGVTNAIFIEGPSVGRLLFTGPGAGGQPTASAMLGDLIQVASRGRGPRTGSAHDPKPRRQVLHR